MRSRVQRREKRQQQLSDLVKLEFGLDSEDADCLNNYDSWQQEDLSPPLSLQIQCFPSLPCESKRPFPEITLLRGFLFIEVALKSPGPVRLGKLFKMQTHIDTKLS